jgi:hypothetical protein
MSCKLHLNEVLIDRTLRLSLCLVYYQHRVQYPFNLLLTTRSLRGWWVTSSFRGSAAGYVWPDFSSRTIDD